jgi:hypothetical protein
MQNAENRAASAKRADEIASQAPLSIKPLAHKQAL